MPKRIQRTRAAGFKMPAEVIYVGRPTPWGNPLVGYGAAQAFRDWLYTGRATLSEAAAAYIADGFDVTIVPGVDPLKTGSEMCLDALRGHDLACWCALDKPCHADALLELANR